MTFKISDLKFNVELAPSIQRAASFPNEHCTGITLTRPDEKKRVYKLRISLSKTVCAEAQIKPTGFIIARISDCSKAIQILYQDKQGDKFTGYILRPTGTYKNRETLEKQMKASGEKYMQCYAELAISFDELDTKKTSKFSIDYFDNLHVAKHLVIADITKARLYV